MATFHVNNATGNNGNAGTTAGTAWLTLAFAVTQLAAGDTLLVHGGTNYVNDVIDSNSSAMASGSAGNPITVSAYPGGFAASSTPGPRSGADNVVIKTPNGVHAIRMSTNSPSYWVFQDIVIDGSGNTSAGQSEDIFLAGGSTNNTFLHMEVKSCFHNGIVTSQTNGVSTNNNIQYCSLHDCGQDTSQGNTGYGIYINTASNLVEGCDIYNNHGYGGQINNVVGIDASNNIIRRNKFHNNILNNAGGVGGTTGGGFNFACNDVGHCDNTQFYDNLVYNNDVGGPGGSQGDGLGIYNHVSNAQVYNNTFYGNNGNAITMQYYAAGNVIRNNIFYNQAQTNGIQDFGDINGAFGTFTADHNDTTNPTFVSTSTPDFHLQNTSNAIGQGQHQTLFTTDFDTVSWSNPPSQGAYEFVGGGGGGNVVVFGADGTTDDSVNGVVSLSDTFLTAGSNANGAILIRLTFSNQLVDADLVVTWDAGGTNQVATRVPGAAGSTPGTTGRAYLYYVLNPTAGNKTLTASWSASHSSDATMFAAYYYNVNQTGGSTSFPNATVATGTSSTTSLTISSATGHQIVETSCDDNGGGGVGNGAYLSSTQTIDNQAGGLNNLNSGSSRAAGAASVNFAWTLNTSANWVSVGCDIAPPTVSGTWSFVTAQHAHVANTSGGTTLVLVLPSNPTTGNLVTIGFEWFDGVHASSAITSIKDTNGNNYQLTPQSPSNAQGVAAGAAYVGYLVAPANADKTVTITFASTFTDASGFIDEFHSSIGSIALATSVFGSGTGATINTPSINATNNLLYSYAVSVNGINGVGGSWTALETLPVTEGDAAAYILNTGTTSVNFTQSAAGGWNSIGASFVDGQNTIDTQGYHPDTSRAWPLHNVGLTLSQTTPIATPFSPEMVQGQHVDRPRLFIVRPTTPIGTFDMVAFPFESVIGSHPDQPRLMLGPRIPLPLSQAMHLAGPFSPEMVLGVHADPFRFFPQRESGGHFNHSIVVMNSPEMFQGVHPDQPRLWLPLRVGFQWQPPDNGAVSPVPQVIRYRKFVIQSVQVQPVVILQVTLRDVPQ